MSLYLLTFTEPSVPRAYAAGPHDRPCPVRPKVTGPSSTVITSSAHPLRRGTTVTTAVYSHRDCSVQSVFAHVLWAGTVGALQRERGGHALAPQPGARPGHAAVRGKAQAKHFCLWLSLLCSDLCLLLCLPFYFCTNLRLKKPIQRRGKKGKRMALTPENRNITPLGNC